MYMYSIYNVHICYRPGDEEAKGAGHVAVPMATLVVCLAPVVSPKDGTVAVVAMAAALAADLVVSVAMAATLVYVVVGPVVAMATPTAGGSVGLVVGFVSMAAAPVGSVGPAVTAVAMAAEAADCSVALAVPTEDVCLLVVVVDPAYVVVVGPMDVVVVHAVLPTDVVVVVVVCHVVVADGHAGVVDLAPGLAAMASAKTRECLQGSQAPKQTHVYMYVYNVCRK